VGGSAGDDKGAKRDQYPKIGAQILNGAQLARNPEQAQENRAVGDGDQAIHGHICPYQPRLLQVAIAVRQVLR
jgi:hypothetical protein